MTLERIIKNFIKQFIFAFKLNRKKSLENELSIFIESSRSKSTDYEKNRDLVILNTKSSELEFNEPFGSNVELKLLGLPKSNASVYFLSSKNVKLLPSSSYQPNYIGIQGSSILSNFFRIIKIVLSGEYFLKGYVKKIGKLYFIFENPLKVSLTDSTRKYIGINHSRLSFLQELTKRGVNYVMLRWFDDIRVLGDLTEDIDILLDDEELDNVFSFLNESVGLLPLDIYSVSGVDGANYGGLPYYVRSLAEQVLDTKVINGQGFCVPNALGHLYTMLYHVLYHKSITKSGLHFWGHVTCKSPEHDYNNVLRELFLENDLEVPDLTHEQLYEWLKKRIEIPSFDLLLKLAEKNNHDNWYSYLIKESKLKISEGLDNIEGLSVFLLRDYAYKGSNVEISRETFREFGFTVLAEGEINSESRKSVASNIRGGNWNKGPYEMSGGVPAYYFVVFDEFVSTPVKEVQRRYPYLENYKVLDVKNGIRTLLMKTEVKSFNGIHSSDNFYDSIDYLRHLNFSKTDVEGVLFQCSSIKNQYDNCTDFEVVQDLSRKSKRALVQKINYKGGYAVKKTYKISKSNYLKNELEFLNFFKEDNRFPSVLMSKDNYFIMEYFEGVGVDKSDIVSRIDLARQFKDIMNTIFKKGYMILDANPSNLMYSKNELKMIDFEFAKPLSKTIKSVDQLYELGKIPNGYNFEKPVGHDLIEDAYNKFWNPLIRLKKEEFLYTDSSILWRFYILKNRGLSLLSKVKNKIVR